MNEFLDYRVVLAMPALEKHYGGRQSIGLLRNELAPVETLAEKVARLFLNLR